MKNFKIKGSMTTEGDLNIQGSLYIKGQSTSVAQETLTVKDNFIAINGNGTTLETAGMAGIIAVTGKEQYVLNSGDYVLDGGWIAQFLECDVIQIPNERHEWYEDEPEFIYTITVSKNKFWELWDILSNLAPTRIGNGEAPFLQWYADGQEEDIGNDRLKFNYGNCTVNYLFQDGPEDYMVGMTGCWAIYADQITGELMYGDYSDNIRLENQIILQQYKEQIFNLLKKKDGSALTDNDCLITGQAYAAPIYDANEDSLKIGLGSYTKNEQGDITGFTFGAGQGQSIATRANNIQDGHLIKWDATKNKLVDAGSGNFYLHKVYFSTRTAEDPSSGAYNADVIELVILNKQSTQLTKDYFLSLGASMFNTAISKVFYTESNPPSGYPTIANETTRFDIQQIEEYTFEVFDLGYNLIGTMDFSTLGYSDQVINLTE